MVKPLVSCPIQQLKGRRKFGLVNMIGYNIQWYNFTNNRLLLTTDWNNRLTNIPINKTRVVTTITLNYMLVNINVISDVMRCDDQRPRLGHLHSLSP